jgi:ribosome-associated protein
MLKISNYLSIPDSELQFEAIRSQGAGGQNVNKVATAIHLRFDILASSLPETVKDSLVKSSDQRINKDSVIIIKAQRFRTQEKNKIDALDRLKEFILKATVVRKKRKATKPTKSSKNKRVDSKTKRGQIKTMRSKPDY